MNFELFTKHLEVIENLDPKGRAGQIASLINDIDEDEVAGAIYLLQGRLAETYLKRDGGFAFIRPIGDSYRIAQAPRIIFNDEGLTSCLTKLKGQTPGTDLYNENIEIKLFYKLLHESIGTIDSWLSGKTSAPSWLVKFYNQSNNLERKYIVRILLGPLFNDEEIISALANTLLLDEGTKNTIIDAYKHTILDLGRIAHIIKKDGYSGLFSLSPTLGIPIKPQELWQWTSIEEVWYEYGPCYVQPKFDGWEIQIHKNGGEVNIFSRHLQQLTPYLPDVVEACHKQIESKSIILDCEMVGYNPQLRQILPVQQTMSARNHKVFIHNIILYDGEDWREKQYYLCRQLLRDLFPVKSDAVICTVYDEFVDNLEDLRSRYERWKSYKDTEGAVFKKINGKYYSGRDTQDQGKLKPRISLDVVILGYNLSRKKIPSFLVGVLSEKKTNLIEIGMVEGVLTSEEIRMEILKNCLQLQTPNKPEEIVGNFVPSKWVRPEIVIEIETDGIITKSRRFNHYGYALNKKKKLRLRGDLGPEDADTMAVIKTFRFPPGVQ